MTKREIQWPLSNHGAISIDSYERVDSLSVDNVSVKIQLKSNTSAMDKKQINVFP